MQFAKYFRSYGVRTVGVLAVLGCVMLTLGAGGAVAQSTSGGGGSTASASNTTSSSHIVNSSNSVTQDSNTSESNGASNFANSGTVSSGGGGAETLGPSTVPQYLPASPELNGPGSLEWCQARSSCSLSANDCAAHCQHDTLADGTAQSDTGDSGTASQTASDAGQSQVSTNITNFSSLECSQQCQSSYQSCSNQVSTICSLSQ